MERIYVLMGFLSFTCVSGLKCRSTEQCLNDTHSAIVSLVGRNRKLMERFVQERFDGTTPPHQRLDFTGIQQIEENMDLLDKSSNGSFPRPTMSIQEAGAIYKLHHDTLQMFRIALRTILELEHSMDGNFMTNLTNIMRCIHMPVKRLEVLVESHPCDTESNIDNFRVEFETISSGQVCGGTCLHRQSYHILQKFEYFLRRAENTFTAIIVS